MSEQIITSIFLLICLGQIWAFKGGRYRAVAYYMCFAPLGYFSIWQFGTWGPARACGIILIIGSIFYLRRSRNNPSFAKHKFFPFFCYVIAVTVIGSFFWPIETMESARSEAYGKLRVIIQLLNWAILAGVSWQIALVISNQINFEKIRKLMINIGILHSAYALYQVFAYYFGLPMTGIRRPYSNIGAAFGTMQYGVDHFLGIPLYRVNSLVGEPKTFGTISLLWITLAITLFIENKRDKYLVIKIVLFFIVLILTHSTVAMTGALIALIVSIIIGLKSKKTRLAQLVTAISIIFCLILFFDSINIFSIGKGGITSIILERTAGAWEGVYREGLSDLPEVEAKKVLYKNPHLFFTGTGLGGISFYIAKNLISSDVVLAPNTGFLSYLCDFGIIGILFMLFTFRTNLALAFKTVSEENKIIVSISYVGLILFLQCFIFSGGLMPFAFAFLFGSGLIRKQTKH